MDLVVEGRIYYRKKLIPACIGIENGKIKKIKKILTGDKYLRVGNKLVLPAGIDIHVHFRDPGYTWKEDFSTGSKAAAFGGIGTTVDMPNTKPRVKRGIDLKEKLDIVSSKSYVDFGLYADGNSRVEELTPCTGFKIYMYELEDEVLHQKMSQISEDKLVAVHAEDKKFIVDKPAKSLEEYLVCRGRAEVEALKKLSLIHRKIHICHLSAKESIHLIARQHSAEVTPHHLFLNVKSKVGLLGMVNPPLREREDNLKLWEALNARYIDVIASDHAPHTLEEKEQGAPGIANVETMYPLMLWAMKNHWITLPTLMEAIAEKPAEFFSLKKGKLEKGYAADLIVVDLKRVERIKPEKLHSKCGVTVWEGRDAIFPTHLVLRGNMIVRDRHLEGTPGKGKFVSL